MFMATCKYRKTGKIPFPLPSTASLRVCQTPLRFLNPMCTWSECAEVILPATARREQLVHDNLQVQEFPFPLPSTASLRVCQTPLRFLVPMCTWSEFAEVMLPATARREQRVHGNLQVQENWQVSLHFHPQLCCVCARRPCDSWILCAHGASALK